MQTIMNWMIPAFSFAAIIISALFYGEVRGRSREKTKQLQKQYDDERTRGDVEASIRNADDARIDSMLDPWKRKRE